MITIIGDKMLLYDRDKGLFFVGYKKKKMKPIWSENMTDGMVLNRLADAYRLKEQLGLGVRIISATEARKINMLREYRGAENAKSKV